MGLPFSQARSQVESLMKGKLETPFSFAAARDFFGGKRVLVTGGAGFIGSHIVEQLLAAGAAVRCIDSMLTGSEANVVSYMNHPGFTHHKQDVIDPYEHDTDFIFNLACAASPRHYQANPVHTFKTNIFGALNALELASKTSARVLQASTSEVYGTPKVHPQTESYWGHVNPVGIRSCYDEGKRGAETLFTDYSSQFGVDARIVRIFNTYGPRMREDDGRVVSNFIVQALKNEDITIYGDGSQTRSFCYIDDLVFGLISAMMFSGPYLGPVNLGNPEEFTVRELAQLVLDLTGSSSAIVYKPLPPDDPTQRRPDIELAGSLLGWQPRIRLREGLERTIWYFDEALRGASSSRSGLLHGKV